MDTTRSVTMTPENMRQILQQCGNLVDPLDAFVCGEKCEKFRAQYLRKKRPTIDTAWTETIRFETVEYLWSPADVLQKLERMRQRLLANKSYIEEQLSQQVQSHRNNGLVNSKRPQLHRFRGIGTRAAAMGEKGLPANALKMLHGARGTNVTGDAKERKKKQRQAVQKALLKHIWQSNMLKKEAEPIFTVGGVLDMSASAAKPSRKGITYRGHDKARETALQLRLKPEAARSITRRFRDNPNYPGAREVLDAKLPRLGQPLFLTPQGHVRGGGQRVDHARFQRYGVKQGMFLRANARNVYFVKNKKPSHVVTKYLYDFQRLGAAVRGSPDRFVADIGSFNPHNWEPLVGSQVQVGDMRYTISVGKETTGKFQAYYFTSLDEILSPENLLRHLEFTPYTHDVVQQMIQKININAIFLSVRDANTVNPQTVSPVVVEDVYIPNMVILARADKNDDIYYFFPESSYLALTFVMKQGWFPKLVDQDQAKEITDPPEAEGIYYWDADQKKVLTKSQAIGVAREYVRNHASANEEALQWYTKRTKHTLNEIMSPLPAILNYTRERLGLERLASAKPLGRQDERPKRLPPRALPPVSV